MRGQDVAKTGHQEQSQLVVWTLIRVVLRWQVIPDRKRTNWLCWVSGRALPNDVGAAREIQEDNGATRCLY